MSEELFQKLETASKVLKKGLTIAEKGGVAEGEYGKAYQNLVRVGLVRQLRKKYRQRKG